MFSIDIERLLQMQYNSKLYPELLKVENKRKLFDIYVYLFFVQNMINFTGVRLLKFNTELELPVDTSDLEDLKDAE